MRVWVTRQIAGMQGDPTPRHAIHVRHLRAFIDAGGMMNLLLQDCENASRRAVTWSTCADTRPRDADTVAIDVCYLLSNAGDNQQRSFRRTLGFPNILARLSCNGF